MIIRLKPSLSRFVCWGITPVHPWNSFRSRSKFWVFILPCLLWLCEPRLSQSSGFIDECSYWSALDFCRLSQTGEGTWLICLRKEFCAGEKVPSVNALSGCFTQKIKISCFVWYSLSFMSKSEILVNSFPSTSLVSGKAFPGAVSPPHPKKEEERWERRTKEKKKRRKEMRRKSSKNDRCKQPAERSCESSAARRANHSESSKEENDYQEAPKRSLSKKRQHTFRQGRNVSKENKIMCWRCQKEMRV